MALILSTASGTSISARLRLSDSRYCQKLAGVHNFVPTVVNTDFRSGQIEVFSCTNHHLMQQLREGLERKGLASLMTIAVFTARALEEFRGELSHLL